MPLHFFHLLFQLIRFFLVTNDALKLKFSLGATDRLLLVVVYRSPSSDVSDDLALLDFLREVVGDPSITHLSYSGGFRRSSN